MRMFAWKEELVRDLTAANVDFNLVFNHVLWIKVIPLKVNIYI